MSKKRSREGTKPKRYRIQSLRRGIRNDGAQRMEIKLAYQFSPKGFIRLAEGFNPVLLGLGTLLGVKSTYQFSPKGFIRLAEGFNPVLLGLGTLRQAQALK